MGCTKEESLVQWFNENDSGTVGHAGICVVASFICVLFFFLFSAGGFPPGTPVSSCSGGFSLVFCFCPLFEIVQVR